MDNMSKLLNRIAESRFAGVGILPADPAVCRTRAEFVQRIRQEAVSYQVENEDGEVEEGIEAGRDEELQGLIEDIRTAEADGEALRAWALATETRRYLIANGYCDEGELPTYRTR